MTEKYYLGWLGWGGKRLRSAVPLSLETIQQIAERMNLTDPTAADRAIPEEHIEQWKDGTWP